MFPLFRNSDSLAGIFRWSEDPNTAWLYLRPQKIALAENRFLQGGKGAQNAKEKFRQCFYGERERPPLTIINPVVNQSRKTVTKET